ncbi:MAG TPA: hypothetical protein VJZ00_21055 [Thermoanaerobaculia bacterium]|nr:hypothetical protein [Thermoanaerobaculia bacterium]
MTITPDAPREEVPPSLEPLLPVEDVQAEATPHEQPGLRIPPLSVPTRTVPLFCFLLAIGAMVLAFTYANVHHRTSAEMASNPGMVRTSFSINFWVERGYIRAGGLLMRPAPTAPGFYIYLSSTGGHLFSAYVLEKLWKVATGHTSLPLIALQNQIVTLLLAALVGLLAFRLATRMGSSPLHALFLATCVEVVHFTFPDNLAMFWELSGRQPFLIFAAAFLLIEERCIDGRTPTLTTAQGVAAFLAMYMEYGAGAAFLASYVVVSMLLGVERMTIKRILTVAIFPLLLTLALFGLQRKIATAQYPTATKYGSNFLFRSGLDGSSQYYGTHLDIANGRDLPRRNFKQNQKFLFEWTWSFFAGSAALTMIILFGARGRIPPIVLVSLLSLLGSYLLYAALFSQAFVIHPYLFDVLLFTPLMLALFVIAPSFVESLTAQRGVFVAVIFFLAAWVTMVQLRQYALRYPLPPPATRAHS